MAQSIFDMKVPKWTTFKGKDARRWKKQGSVTSMKHLPKHKK